jgi:hypothetical protein
MSCWLTDWILWKRIRGPGDWSSPLECIGQRIQTAPPEQRSTPQARPGTQEEEEEEVGEAWAQASGLGSFCPKLWNESQWFLARHGDWTRSVALGPGQVQQRHHRLLFLFFFFFFPPSWQSFFLFAWRSLQHSAADLSSRMPGTHGPAVQGRAAALTADLRALRARADAGKNTNKNKGTIIWTPFSFDMIITSHRKRQPQRVENQDAPGRSGTVFFLLPLLLPFLLSLSARSFSSRMDDRLTERWREKRVCKKKKRKKKKEKGKKELWTWLLHLFSNVENTMARIFGIFFSLKENAVLLFLQTLFSFLFCYNQIISFFLFSPNIYFSSLLVPVRPCMRPHWPLCDSAWIRLRWLATLAGRSPGMFSLLQLLPGAQEEATLGRREEEKGTWEGAEKRGWMSLEKEMLQIHTKFFFSFCSRSARYIFALIFGIALGLLVLVCGSLAESLKRWPMVIGFYCKYHPCLNK